MSAYNLKQHLNEWTNIEVSIDNNTGTVDLFVNGTQQQFTAGANVTAGTSGSKSLNISGKQITKNTDSKFHIGGNKDGDKEFTGKMERIEFSNKARNAAAALAKYRKLKRRESDSMMSMRFNARGNSRSLSDKSVYKSQAKFRRDDSYVGDKAVMAINTDTVRNVDREAVQFAGGDYIEMDAATTMYGDKLINSTFTSWIKTPSKHDPDSYEPIISRENVFSFGLNNGHASLFLSQNNQLAPGTNVSREASSAVTVGQAVSSVMEPTHENLLVDANFNTTDTKITKPASSEYSSIIPGSKVVKLTSSDKIEVDRTALIGKNMNKFTFSGWVNFSSLNDNAVLFERPDAGLKLSTNASGQVSLDFNPVTDNVYEIQVTNYTNDRWEPDFMTTNASLDITGAGVITGLSTLQINKLSEITSPSSQPSSVNAITFASGSWSSTDYNGYNYEKTENNSFIYRLKNQTDLDYAKYGIRYDYVTKTWVDSGYDDPLTITKDGNTIKLYNSSGGLNGSFEDPYSGLSTTLNPASTYPSPTSTLNTTIFSITTAETLSSITFKYYRQDYAAALKVVKDGVTVGTVTSATTGSGSDYRHTITLSA